MRPSTLDLREPQPIATSEDGLFRPCVTNGGALSRDRLPFNLCRRESCAPCSPTDFCFARPVLLVLARVL